MTIDTKFKEIRKRDGRIVVFDKDKIIGAIEKVGNSAGTLRNI